MKIPSKSNMAAANTNVKCMRQCLINAFIENEIHANSLLALQKSDFFEHSKTSVLIRKFFYDSYQFVVILLFKQIHWKLLQKLSHYEKFGFNCFKRLDISTAIVTNNF